MIKDRLKKDQLAALKSAKKSEVEAIRYILSQIQNKEIEKQAQLSDEEVVSVLRRLVKELKESMDANKMAKRAEAIQKNEEELALVSRYLPPEISDEELKKEIEAVIQKNQELYTKNPKAIMGICVKELKSKADPGRIVRILREV